ncbi:MAG: hypothetical protein R2855_04920 [Thermomicrobiales bacterium]
MVQRRPDYDALAATTQTYDVLSRAFETAGIDPEPCMSNQPRRDLDISRARLDRGQISPPDNRTRVTEAGRSSLVQSRIQPTTALPCVPEARREARVHFRLGQDRVGEWIRQSLGGRGRHLGGACRPWAAPPISLASVDAWRKTFAYYRFPAYSEPLGTL